MHIWINSFDATSIRFRIYSFFSFNFSDAFSWQNMSFRFTSVFFSKKIVSFFPFRLFWLNSVKRCKQIIYIVVCHLGRISSYCKLDKIMATQNNIAFSNSFFFGSVCGSISCMRSKTVRYFHTQWFCRAFSCVEFFSCVH